MEVAKERKSLFLFFFYLLHLCVVCLESVRTEPAPGFCPVLLVFSFTVQEY